MSKSLLVRFDDLALVESIEMSKQLNILKLGLFLLNAHNHVDAVLDVETLESLPELASLELGVVQHVMDQVVKQV